MAVQLPQPHAVEPLDRLRNAAWPMAWGPQGTTQNTVTVGTLLQPACILPRTGSANVARLSSVGVFGQLSDSHYSWTQPASPTPTAAVPQGSDKQVRRLLRFPCLFSARVWSYSPPYNL